jgi:hypothetical protein
LAQTPGAEKQDPTRPGKLTPIPSHVSSGLIFLRFCSLGTRS